MSDKYVITVPIDIGDLSPEEKQRITNATDAALQKVREERLSNNAKWYVKRTLIGLTNIIDNALQTARAIVPEDDESGYSSDLNDIADTIYEMQLALKSLNEKLHKLPQI